MKNRTPSTGGYSQNRPDKQKELPDKLNELQELIRQQEALLAQLNRLKKN